LIAAGALVFGGSFLAADEKKAGDQHAAHFEQCAKACADCLRECESCAHHCADLVAAGKKEHLRTLGTCADCADVCAAAAKIVSRHGPLAGTICESCARACGECAAECEKTPGDEHMKRCAKVCRDCEKACRDMLEHVRVDLKR
jgi:hypothetical protein